MVSQREFTGSTHLTHQLGATFGTETTQVSGSSTTTSVPAAAMPKYVINDGNLASRLERGVIPGEVTYIVFENVLDTDGTTVLGNKPAKVDEAPADNYIKMEFVDGVCQILFKNVHYKRTAGTSEFLQIYNMLL